MAKIRTTENKVPGTCLDLCFSLHCWCIMEGKDAVVLIPLESYHLRLVQRECACLPRACKLHAVSPDVTANVLLFLFWHPLTGCKELVLAYSVGRWRIEEQLSITSWRDVAKKRRKEDNPMYFAHRWPNSWLGGIPHSSTCSPTHFHHRNLSNLTKWNVDVELLSRGQNVKIMPPFGRTKKFRSDKNS